MSAAKDGGPAFPIAPIVIGERLFDANESYGMTIRDYFAGQALNAVMRFGGSDMWNTDRQPAMASLAYEMADAMLAERSQP